MSHIEKQVWGQSLSGEQVQLYTLRNATGTEAAITDFGGRLVTLKTADRRGTIDDIVLGFDDLSGYLRKNPYFGALVGRYANRIANGRFTLDGHSYSLARNNGENALHGGIEGFDKKVWQSRKLEGPVLHLTYTSADGEEGYPGTLKVSVVYTLTDDNELKIDYFAETDKTTVLNLTNHSYFDLSGQFAGEILQHEVMINADKFTPVNHHLIPTGELRDVEGSPFDLRKSGYIADHIDDDDEQIKLALGYDHNFVLNGSGLRLAARVRDPQSGRILEVLTTQPGMQFYTGNHLDGTVIGKGGVAYKFRYGFCCETQFFPDSPNQPQFPSTQLEPGNEFHAQTIFRLSTDKQF